MRIGLVSKSEHCRPHAQALKGLGVKVKVLGGDVGLTIPQRMDALVVRTCSISHAAFNVAKAWERAGGKVFYIEGAGAAAKAVEEWMMDSQIVKMKLLMNRLGWCHWHIIKSLDHETFVRLGIKAEWDKAQEFAEMNPSTVRGLIKRAAEEMKWESISLHPTQVPRRGRPYTFYTKPRLSDAQAARILMCVEEIANRKEVTHSAPAPAPKPAKAPTPQTKEVPVKTAPQTPIQASPAPAPSESQIPQDIKDAVSILALAMNEHGFDSMTIGRDGSVQYERVIRVASAFQIKKDW